MKKLHEIIELTNEHLGSDYNRFLLTEDVKRYKKLLAINYEPHEMIMVFTDSYGCAGFLVPASEYHEGVMDYIQTLEPANEQEKEDWIESLDAMFLKDI